MPELQEYKGNKLICLNPGAKFPFSFGMGKAKMILENIEAIKIFVESNGDSCGEPAAEKPAAEKTEEPKTPF